MMQPDPKRKKSPKVPRPGAAFGMRPGSPQSAAVPPEVSGAHSTGSATGSGTAWTPRVEDFEGLHQEDWFDYVRAAHKAYESPSLRTIQRQARKREKGCTLGRGTVHSALRGDNWPTAQTAYWLGIGIGGHDLGAQFRNGWRAADGNLRKDVHEVIMSKALVLRGSPELRMERRERREEDRRERAEARKLRRRRLAVLVGTLVAWIVTLVVGVGEMWGWSIFLIGQ
ncbi:hypothetical protein ACFWA1_35930 [Streptomyces sp. NPDC060005]|uniref:hypothetical protein n=1 Tax=Streptomyces sp. NPDC060005 TaxID=3347034 RepID=UPI0036D07479